MTDVDTDEPGVGGGEGKAWGLPCWFKTTFILRSQAAEPPGPAFTASSSSVRASYPPLLRAGTLRRGRGRAETCVPRAAGMLWVTCLGVRGMWGAVSLTPGAQALMARSLLQVTVVIGASQDIIPQLKKKYDVDTLDMVFLDHWKDRYLPDTLLLEVSCAPPGGGGWLPGCTGCRDARWASAAQEPSAAAEPCQGGLGGHRWLLLAARGQGAQRTAGGRAQDGPRTGSGGLCQGSRWELLDQMV